MKESEAALEAWGQMEQSLQMSGQTWADFLSSSSFARFLQRNRVTFVELRFRETLSPPIQFAQHTGIMEIMQVTNVRLNFKGTLSPLIVRHPGNMQIQVTALRQQEEAKEAGSFVRFLRALPTSLGSESLVVELSLSEPELLPEELAALCDGIASPLCSLIDLCIRFRASQLSAEESQQGHGLVSTTVNESTILASSISRALLTNTSLRRLRFDVTRDSVKIIDQCVHPALIARSTSSSSCPISSLQIYLKEHGTNVEEGAFRIFVGLADNSIALTDLGIRAFPIEYRLRDSGGVLSRMLETNASLQNLQLRGMELPGQVVEALFTSLRKNAELRATDLWGCSGEGWPSAGLVLDSLRAQGLITELDLGNTPLAAQSEAAIEAQLRRNARNVEERERMKQQGASEVEPSCVRLFLCGLPFSGKTTLSTSLVKWASSSHGPSCLPISRRMSGFPRTRGIEVSTLQYGGVTLSLWDMAGQDHYYAYHDHMLPNLSNEATPSLLLFVWSPIQINQSSGEHVKDASGDVVMKTLDMFDQEFRFWLRFAASKTLKSLTFRPRLLVAVTRGDLVKFSIESWFKGIFIQCQKDFEEYIQLDMDKVFKLDARVMLGVKDLASAIFDSAVSMLRSMPKVYRACEQMKSRLAGLRRENILSPLISKKEFMVLCKRYLGTKEEEMEEAIARSLHESGDLIYFKQVDLVVVDTQWFCNHIMGDLLNFAHEKQLQDRGFFTLEFLERLLESKAGNAKAGNGGRHFSKWSWCGRREKTESPKVEGKALVELLKGLQLACESDDDHHQGEPRIFVPISLCTSDRRQVQPAWFLKRDEGTRTYLGRRLKCKDSIRTFLTPALFPLLQVTFDNLFPRTETKLEQDIIALFRGGVKVLVEFCKVEQSPFIDILVHSHLELDATIGQVYKDIIERIKKVCAEPRNNQGVELVEEVINPSCVKTNAVMDMRMASVPLEQLRKALSDHLERKGPRLDGCLYTWPTTYDSDCVKDLLGGNETLKVITAYKHAFIRDVEDVLGVNIEKEDGSSKGEDMESSKQFCSTVSGKERQLIFNTIKEVQKDVQAMHKDIEKILLDIQRQCESLLPRLQEQLAFLKEREMASLPRMFVLTRNGGGVRKVIGAMIPSIKNVRLELLCEHQSQPHLVEQQAGLSFETMEDGLLRQGLPYIKMFLRCALVVMKVGASVAAGLGSAIPDFSKVLAFVVDAPQLTPVSAISLESHSQMSRLDVQNGQRWLHVVLTKHNCLSNERIHEVFGISRVLYGDSHVGWLCDAHASEGELCPI